MKDRAIITGSPKFDFLTDNNLNSINQPEIEEIKNKYGRYILFPQILVSQPIHLLELNTR